MSQSAVTPQSQCPYCGAEVDRARNVTSDDAPEPGDVTVCFYCARLSEFAGDLTLRAPSVDRLNTLLANAEVRRVISAVKRHGPRQPGRRP